MKIDLKKFFSKFKRQPKKQRALLIKKWKILIVVSAFLLIAVAGLGGYIFFDLKKNVEGVVFSESSVLEVAKKQDLEDVVEYLKNKRERFNKILLEFSQIPDSSS